MGNWLGVVTLLLFILQKVYWLISSKKAYREKPRIRVRPSFFSRARVPEYGFYGFLLLLFMQFFLHVSILPISILFPIDQIGFLCVLVGLGLGIVARKQLADNWANSWEYQIKQKQELVTTGVYGVIRHPIYASFWVAAIGAELVAKSWLFILFLSYFLVAYRQAKKEEILLEKHFGSTYKTYMKRTKMFIPYLW